MTTNQTFGQALEAMKQGKYVSREIWTDGRFIFMQVPSEVPAAIIQKMTSLPKSVKDAVMDRSKPLRYQDQMAMVNADNNVFGWSPSASDCFASDWWIWDTEFVVAGETVGTATPL